MNLVDWVSSNDMYTKVFQFINIKTLDSYFNFTKKSNLIGNLEYDFLKNWWWLLFWATLTNTGSYQQQHLSAGNSSQFTYTNISRLRSSAGGPFMQMCRNDFSQWKLLLTEYRLWVSAQTTNVEHARETRLIEDQDEDSDSKTKNVEAKKKRNPGHQARGAKSRTRVAPFLAQH